MFYKLMYKRSMQKYKKSYFNILCIFIISLSMLSFIRIYCDSYYNYNDTVLLDELTKDHTCDIRVRNISEEEAELFALVPYVEMKYSDGNLDFFLLDTAEFENVHRNYIMKIFNENLFDNTYTEDSPAINIYYGRDAGDLIDDYDDTGAREASTLFQVILSAIGIVSMVMIYSDYIMQRTDDIRTLSAIGITKRQLHRLLFGECNILYLISAMIGIPLGGVIAYLFCLICEVVDMSQSNAVYPVFDIDVLSLLITALVGYVVIYITFRIVMKKVLDIDASYTCAETAVEFDPDRSRGFFQKSDRHFDLFFSSVLRKRSSSKSKLVLLPIILIIAVSIFMLSAVCYSFEAANSHGVQDSAAVAAFFSNASLFIMTMVYAILYGLVIIIVFTKRHMESCKDSVQILYAIGADESIVYSCFHRYTVKNIISSLLLGFGVGYAFTVFVFNVLNYNMEINFGFFLGNSFLIVAYYFAYMISMKKYFLENCRSAVLDETEGDYVTA